MDWHKVILTAFLGGQALAMPLLAQTPRTDVDPIPKRRICVVLGAPGDPTYAETFVASGNRWKETHPRGEWTWIDGATTEGTTTQGNVSEGSDREGSHREGSDRDSIEPDTQRNRTHRDALLEWVKTASGDEQEHWLVLIGHGTHDPRATQFNLKGPDVSAVDLAKALDGKPGRWVIIVCSSCSGPFLKALSGPKRVIITATKSGAESNYTRFGDYLSQGLSETAGDLDHDGTMSLLELFLYASQRTQKYYDEEKLLATEQALLDDNGDGKGTPASFYRGMRAVKAPAEGASVDGLVARSLYWNQSDQNPDSIRNREEIAALEIKLETLRREKGAMTEEAYYRALEELLLQIAPLHGLKPRETSDKSIGL